MVSTSPSEYAEHCVLEAEMYGSIFFINRKINGLENLPQPKCYCG